MAKGEVGALDRLGGEVPVSGSLSPSRVVDFSATTTEKLPRTGSIAATSRWMELVPMSMAATRRSAEPAVSGVGGMGVGPGGGGATLPPGDAPDRPLERHRQELDRVPTPDRCPR